MWPWHAVRDPSLAQPKHGELAGGLVSVACVSATDIEALVLDGVRKHLASIGEAEHPTALDDHDLIASPRIIAAIVRGTAPADLTIAGLAKALLHSWGEQEQSVGPPQ